MANLQTGIRVPLGYSIDWTSFQDTMKGISSLRRSLGWMVCLYILFPIIFLLYLNLELVNVVYCLHSSVTHMPLRVEHTDATWEHNPHPDQLCQSRIPASLEMTVRDAHVNPAHSTPANTKHHNFS